MKKKIVIYIVATTGIGILSAVFSYPVFYALYVAITGDSPTYTRILNYDLAFFVMFNPVIAFVLFLVSAIISAISIVKRRRRLRVAFMMVIPVLVYNALMLGWAYEVPFGHKGFVLFWAALCLIPSLVFIGSQLFTGRLVLKNTRANRFSEHDPDEKRKS